MDLSCKLTHLHKFDNIETLSEPKIIYVNQTLYKLFYKNKSIEISCPDVNISDLASKKPDTNAQPETTQDYLISDSLTGRYYTCYSLNKRNGEVEEIKICLDNIPSFKTYIKKTISYANILLKRIISIRHISNFSTCYTTKRFEQLDNTDYQEKTSNIPCVTIENASSKSKSNSLISNISTTTTTREDIQIKRQFVIKETGHFKFFKNNTILINFIDRVKIFMDEHSMQMFLRENLKKCFCLIYLSDNSQHEICLAEKSEISDFFAKYVSFLEQWLNWLLETETIKKVIKSHIENVPKAENLSYTSMQSHLSQLKLFNYTIDQDSIAFEAKCNIANNTHEPSLSVSVVSNLLKENSKFLQSISK
jgi:hypothetical protein